MQLKTLLVKVAVAITMFLILVLRGWVVVALLIIEYQANEQ